MSEIQQQLKDIVQSKMIPECELYLNDLLKLLEDKTATDEDKEAIKEMEDFLVELQNIIEAIEQNEMNDDDAKMIFGKILQLLEEHK
ncbi:MAG: hypothetical protein U9Q04_00800 [Campylobacterota bacterium]|nr:hypothetical protein [Campylobacterota bacterium]